MNVIPATPPPAEQGFQLSPQQRRAWSLLKANGGDGFFVHWALLLEGELDPGSLRQALESVVRRHEILRTVYRQLPGLTYPVQVISEPAIEWIQGAAGEDPGALLPETTRQPFGLASGPVLRVALKELSSERHVLLLTLPSLCADPLSMANLARELAACLESSPKPDPVQYADVSEVFNDLLVAEDTVDGRSYWRFWDPASLDASRLPFSTVAPRGSVFRPLARELSLEPDLLERLLRAAGFAGVEVEDFLLAAWRVFLEKRTGEGGITVGVAFDGRMYEGLDEALGLFARYLPVAVGLGDDPPFAEAAQRIAEARRSLVEWQEFFEWAEEGRFFPFLFDFERDPGLLAAGDLTISPWLRRSVLERFHLRLAAGSLGGRLTMTVEADPEVIPAATLERLATGFHALLEAAADNPQRPGTHLPVLGEPERTELLVDFNRTAAPYPADRSVPELISEQARRAPDQVAVAAGDRRLTYAELDALADQLAHQISQAGVGPEQTVALFAERSPEVLVALLGILKSGAAFLPLDSFHPAERLAAILKDARPRLVLAHERLMHRLPDLPAAILPIDGALEADPTHATRTASPAVVGPQQLAYVIYTSGSTGRPKGVMVSHQGLTNYLSWCQGAYSLAPGAVVPVHSPLGFDLTVTSLFAPLLAGGTVLVIPEAEGIEALSSLLEEGLEYDLVKLTPAHLDALQHLPDSFAAAPRFRSIILGGEALRGESLSRWRESSPSMRIFNEYGPTETVVGCSVYEIPPGPPTPGPVPIGKPIANAALYVLDTSFAPVPPGVAGELYIGGDGVARGYSGLPGLTAERFVPDPFGGRPGQRLYRTGDLAVLDQEGELVYLGRRDHQVKIRGFRIELGEIEAVAGRQPGVADVVVTAPMGREGQRRLVCYVVPRPGEKLNVQGIRESLERELPKYMVPASFVVLPTLPLTPNGKVDRSALPPPDERGDLGSPYAGPRNETERILVKLWEEFLKLERVGIHDNFFELGGDSILALQVVSRAQRAGIQLVPRQVFEHQTIAALAAAAGSVSGSEEEQGPMVGLVPLTPIQRRFFEQVTVDPHHFNQSILLALHHLGRPTSWERALRVLAAHHDALRLRFTRRDGEWRQECDGPEAGIPLAWIDLSAVSAAERGALIESASAALQGSLDLAHGPLARVAVFDVGPGESGRILLVIHHLLTDAVSWHVVLEDLEALVLGFERGEHPQLPAKTTSFQRWAGLLAEQARSQETAAELDYWTQAAWRGVSLLPRDWADENDEASADLVLVSLEPDETRAFLQEMPERFQVGAGQALLAACASALARWAPGTTVGIDFEGHGRDDGGVALPVNLTRTVGWFTTLYPILVDLSEIDGPVKALRQIDRTMREVPRQGIGYGLLRFSGVAAAAERLRGLPEPELVFNYLGRVGAGAASVLFGAAGESVGPTKSPRQRRSYVLEVNAAVAGDRLRVALIYSRSLHRRESIEALARDVLEALRTLLAGPSETALDDERLGRLLENVEFEV